MRKTYKCSNIKFCMEDENQRRTWEYLQSMSRRDGSYGKVLSDVFTAFLDGQDRPEQTEEAEDMQADLSISEEMLDKKLQRMQEAIAGQIEESMRKYASADHSGTETQENEACGDGMGQVQEPELSEDMMAFALAMGE